MLNPWNASESTWPERTWYENEEILRRFREWLTQTDAEVQAIDAQPSSDGDDFQDDDAAVNLLQMVEAFTALRHELKLQTKSSRGLEQSVSTALDGLNQATDQLRSVRAREAVSVERAMKPLVEALVDLDEALVRGVSVLRRAQQQATDNVLMQLQNRLDEQFQQLHFWQRWRARPWHERAKTVLAQTAADQYARAFDPLLEGYRLIGARLQQTLAAGDVRRIECLGDPVDPARMTVVELIDAPDAEPETVVDVVRPGYEWGDKVIRYAEVRAARRK